MTLSNYVPNAAKPDILTTKPPSYGGGVGYEDPGNPLKDLVRGGDNIRGTVIDLPLIAIAAAYLYDKAWVSNDPDRGWGPGDIVLVLVVAWLIKRFGVGARWEGML